MVSLMYYGYERVSFNPDNLSEAIPRQLEDNDKKALQLGWPELEHIQDNNRSAWKRGVKRKGFERLLGLIREGGARGIVVWNFDRLLRRADDLERLIAAAEDAERAGHPVEIYTTHGQVDLNTSQGRFSARQLTGFAQYESDIKSERVARAWVGAPRRTFSYAHDPTNRLIVEWMVDQVLDHVPLPAICETLNVDGNLSQHGKRWRIGSLRVVLLHHDTIEVVGMERWVAMKSNLEARAISRTPTVLDKHLYVLSGFARCQQCDVSLVGRGTTRKGIYRPQYYCHPGRECGGCGMGIKAVELEDWVIARVRDEIADGTLTQTYVDRDSVDTELRARLDQLDNDYHVEGLLDRDRYLKAIAAITEKIDQQSLQVSTAPTLKQFDRFTREEIRERLPRMLEYVLIRPFDPTKNRQFDYDRIVMKGRTSR